MARTLKFRRFSFLLIYIGGIGLPFVYCQETPSDRHLGVGVNYGGGQLDLRTSPRWMFELRAQQGKDTASIETKSTVAGIRIYRFFPRVKSPSPYLGLELAHVEAQQSSTNYKADGISGGLFAGLEFRLASRLLLCADMGPYMISLREQSTKADRSEVDFVGDTALIFFF